MVIKRTKTFCYLVIIALGVGTLSVAFAKESAPVDNSFLAKVVRTADGSLPLEDGVAVGVGMSAVATVLVFGGILWFWNISQKREVLVPEREISNAPRIQNDIPVTQNFPKDLINYIEDCRAKGLSDGVIRENLLLIQWPERIVSHALMNLPK